MSDLVREQATPLIAIAATEYARAQADLAAAKARVDYWAPLLRDRFSSADGLRSESLDPPGFKVLPVLANSQ